MNKKIIVFLPLIFLLIIAVCFIPIFTSVVFYKEHTNEMLAYAPLKKNQNFSIKYTHSIHMSPVVETYEMTEDKEIRQVELMYEAFAIGMPSNAEGKEKFVNKDGKYYIKNMSNTFPYIYLRVGKVAANHTFISEGDAVRMSSFTKPGSLLKIQIKKLSVWEKWKGVNIHE